MKNSIKNILFTCLPIFLTTACKTDFDHDEYKISEGDCDDYDKTVYPEATELCDGIDQNCNGEIDEGVETTFYRDADKDGFGNPTGETKLSCLPPSGYSATNTDCNDNDDSVNLDAVELCDDIDQNCNGEVDEGAKTTFYLDADSDGFGDQNFVISSCSKPEGYVENSTDCNDSNSDINSNEVETCDGIDNNCDTQIDEGAKTTFYLDADSDGFGDKNLVISSCLKPEGYVENSTDCNDTNSDINSNAVEICDGIDNNCDAQIDEDAKTTFYLDSDKDTFGDFESTILACTIPEGYVENSTDCNDTNSDVNLNAVEICDGIDNNCDSQIDEGVQTTFYLDSDEDTFGDFESTILACTIPEGYAIDSTDCNDTNSDINSNAVEICDGIDNNCDTQVDENTVATFYLDSDNDGFGDLNQTIEACPMPEGYAMNSTDCNDSDSSINPAVTELCDEADNNCNNQIDEGAQTTFYLDSDKDGFGDLNSTISACVLPEGYSTYSTDCNDSNSDINPNSVEVEDDIDNNCNGEIDEINIIFIASGGYHSLAIKGDGTVWAWGLNSYGQLGDGTTSTEAPYAKAEPVQSLNLKEVSSVAGGLYHSLALKSDGTVWAWGDNIYGQLGIDSQVSKTTPTQVTAISNIYSISANGEHSIALKDDGTVWAWGNNDYGQLGIGTTLISLTPSQVIDLTDVSAIAGGLSHSMALKSDGTVWTWGNNDYGQLGNGESNPDYENSDLYETLPVQTSNLIDIISVSSGGYNCLALKSDGTVWAWGDNAYGQLGDGTFTIKATPTQILNLDNITAITIGEMHSMALKNDGSVWAWGDNTYGQLGDGTFAIKSTPTQVSNLVDIKSIVSGSYHSLALNHNNEVWAWGNNEHGQLGNGFYTNSPTPTQSAIYK